MGCGTARTETTGTPTQSVTPERRCARSSPLKLVASGANAPPAGWHRRPRQSPAEWPRSPCCSAPLLDMMGNTALCQGHAADDDSDLDEHSEHHTQHKLGQSH